MSKPREYRTDIPAKMAAEARAIVDELGWVHSEAAEKVGMSAATFSRTVGGKKLWQLDELAYIVETLGGDPDRLLNVGAITSLPRPIRWMVDTVQALPDDEQQRVLRVVAAQTEGLATAPERTAQQQRVIVLIDDASADALDWVEALLEKANARRDRNGASQAG